MTIAITRADFYPLKTIIHTTHVPNWFGRVLLRRKRKKVIYEGHSKVWRVAGFARYGNKPLPKYILANLEMWEGELKKKAKDLNTKKLKFT